MDSLTGKLTKKINDYAEDCKREAEELKRKALAEQKKVEDEIAAWETEMEMREQQRRILEEQEIAKLAEEARVKAQAEGRDETDQMEADIAFQESQARIDADRAAREKEAEDQRIANQKAKDEAQQKTNNTFAVATSVGKIKGVKTVWAIELLKESELDRQFMVFDESKARKWLDGGFYNKDEKNPEKIIPGLRCRQVLGKGGR